MAHIRGDSRSFASLSGNLFDDDPAPEDGPAPRPRFWRRPVVRRVRRIVLVALVLFLVVVGWSVGGALTAPGTDSTAARLAEWGRDHGFGGVITWMEAQQYQQNQPKIGGAPTGGIPNAAGSVGSASGVVNNSGPAPLTVLAGGVALPNEGQWQTVVTVKGSPAVRVAALRPDAQHTSYVAGVMWIDPKLVRGQLQPGYTDPGGTWQASDQIAPADRGSVVAAFNAGFRLNASQGGYYSEGRTVVPLQDNAASMVINNNGVATVGSWNHEVSMSPDVASVRQNLVMLVDNGQVNPSCSSGSAVWGATIGNAAYIDRSAFGVTATGAEVYVGGPALSVCTLGRILQDAGVVRGMELDINPDWVSGVYFHDQPNGALSQGFKLYPTQKVTPTHYLSPSSRDWFGWYARP
ncbi:MAG TPA: hypothetical protein VGM75_12010 [Pseudonocardiaceae bacterium]|jgi:hypothetical protein